MAAPTVDPAAEPTPAARPSPRTRLLFTARLLAAATAGVLLYLSFPPRTLWWLAPLAFAVLGAVLRGARVRAGLAYGVLFGLGFLVPLLSWTGGYVGPLPWLVLAGFEALFLGVAGAGMARVSRLPAAPVWAAAVWAAGEAVRGRVPFGGLPWGRVGFGQPDGPLLPIAAVGGVPLLSFVTVLAGLALAETIRRLVRPAPRTPRRSAALSAVLVIAALLAGPVAALVPVTRTGPDRTVTIAAIQGNVPRLGLDFNAQRRAVLDNHVRETERLAADVAAGRAPQSDLVIWPENSSDIDPLRNADAAAQIDRAAAAVGAPVLVGAVLRNPDGRTTTNSTLVWEAGVGPVERNDKRRVQPFGEYLPWRSFFSLFSSYADRAGYFVPGPGAGVVSIAGVAVGVAICWEVAFDDLVADSVSAGATVLAVPSNNATFGLSEMTYQQLAMSRVRAVEHDRSVIVATTSGVSATITPDGTVTARTGQFVPGTLVGPAVLNSTTTLATRLRSVPEWVLAALGVAAVGVAGVRARRERTRSGPAPAARVDQAGEDEDG
ncbi:apolipoprotein N-acyltransferase [Pseudonocardia sp. H11422]|uniref:apolipoprotein N-acyltransferase n=1 Tax=Pseudonocardia sp. H11422 TaxID=2835866 RepID=UPI001BDC4FA5|nr:apolipoprotein N-acyltransferase [Pseudonocardia sp. H11422]